MYPVPSTSGQRAPSNLSVPSTFTPRGQMLPLGFQGAGGQAGHFEGAFTNYGMEEAYPPYQQVMQFQGPTYVFVEPGEYRVSTYFGGPGAPDYHNSTRRGPPPPPAGAAGFAQKPAPRQCGVVRTLDPVFPIPETLGQARGFPQRQSKAYPTTPFPTIMEDASDTADDLEKDITAADKEVSEYFFSKDATA